MADQKSGVSIKDIAKLAGVSTASVSRILNHKGRYSKKTEEKVISLAKQYGYISNNAAKSLKSSTSKTIGLVIPNIRNDFFSNIAFYIETFLFERDYSVFICDSTNNAEHEQKYYYQLLSQNVDGMIIISSLKQVPEILEHYPTPVVFIDRNPLNSKNIPCFRNDDYEIIYKLTKKLIAQGCSNFIFLGKNADDSNSNYNCRKNAVRDALNSSNIAIDPSRILSVDLAVSSLIGGEVAVSEFLKKEMPLDAVIAADDNLAIGAIYALQRKGIKIPSEVKVTGFDNSFQSRIVSPKLTTVERHSDQIAQAACTTLLKLIDGENLDDINTIIPADIVMRNSSDSQ